MKFASEIATSTAPRLSLGAPSARTGRGWGRGRILIYLLLILLFSSIAFLYSMNPKKSAGNLKIGNVEFTVEIADTAIARAQGLSGRNKICETCGMLFVFDKPQIQNFWMKDMGFPLDMIFIRDNKVVEIVPNVPIPVAMQDIPRVISSEESDKVLEVNAGFSKENSIQIGDILTSNIH